MNDITYLNNVQRVQLGEISIHDYNRFSELVDHIMKMVSEYTQKDGSIDHLRIVLENVFFPFSESLLIRNPDAMIVYSDVIAPNNAVAFADYDGIIFFFHTNEGNHKEYPHIHAKNSGDEISVYLKDYHTKGQFKNRSKEKKAIEYIRTHNDAIQKEWDRIVGGVKG